jgi:hypothetical protein
MKSCGLVCFGIKGEGKSFDEFKGFSVSSSIESEVFLEILKEIEKLFLYF